MLSCHVIFASGEKEIKSAILARKILVFGEILQETFDDFGDLNTALSSIFHALLSQFYLLILIKFFYIDLSHRQFPPC